MESFILLKDGVNVSPMSYLMDHNPEDLLLMLEHGNATDIEEEKQKEKGCQITVKVKVGDNIHLVKCPHRMARMRRVYRVLSEKLNRPMTSFRLLKDGIVVLPRMSMLDHNPEELLLMVNSTNDFDNEVSME